MNVIVDPSFQSTYRQLASSLPQTTLLHGQRGVGLHAIGLSLVPSDYEVLDIQPIKKTKQSLPIISIDVIRRLYLEVRSYARQLVIIDDADTMSEAAQNALLKLIEEPNSTTKFILTSHASEKLLVTIRSRAQSHHVPLVSEASLEPLYSSVTRSDSELRQLHFIAAGRPAELQRLLVDSSYFTRRSAQMSAAKSLLGTDTYNSIAKVQKDMLDRPEATQIIDDMIELLSISPTKSSVRKLSTLIDAKEAIGRGGNVKLQLVRAMV